MTTVPLLTVTSSLSSFSSSASSYFSSSSSTSSSSSSSFSSSSSSPTSFISCSSSALLSEPGNLLSSPSPTSFLSCLFYLHFPLRLSSLQSHATFGHHSASLLTSTNLFNSIVDLIIVKFLSHRLATHVWLRVKTKSNFYCFIFVIIFLFHVLIAPVGIGPLIVEASWSHSDTTLSGTPLDE